MKERAKINKLPSSMAENAVRSRSIASEDPAAVEIDNEFLPWVFCEDSGYWISFDGNYSSKSPAEKRRQAAEYKDRLENADMKALEIVELQIAWSSVRRQVLVRDGNICQVCGGQRSGALHIHHICKRTEGGTDHLDNLITVCNRCHRGADTKLYDPDWSKHPLQP